MKTETQGPAQLSENVGVLKSVGPGLDMAAVGYGEYHPIASNDTAEGRAKNRRIAIVIVPETFSALESREDAKPPTEAPVAPPPSDNVQ